MSRKVLGLEIRQEAVAAVLLESGFKGSTLENQGYFPIAAGGEGDDGLKQALKAAVEALKPAGASCVLGIPATFVSFRNLSVPFHDPKKIRQILPFELEAALPLPVDELLFDFDGVKRDGHQDILAFTVQKVQVQRYLEVLAAVNLRPVGIMPAGYAVARFIGTKATVTEDFLLIDTDQSHHTVYAVCAGSLRLVRTLPLARGGMPVSRHLETSLQRTLTALRESQGIDIHPTVIYSTGPQAQLLTGSTEANTLMGLPVQSIGDIRLFHRLKGALDTPAWQTGHLDMALALALMETEAVGGINFSTERSTLQHLWSEHRGSLIFTAALVVLLLTTALAGQILSLREKRQRLVELDRQIETVFRSTFPEVTRVEAPLHQMRIKLKEAGEGGSALDHDSTRVRIIDILNALSQQIPPSVDVQIGRMVVGSDNVMLSGHTDTFNTVDDIKGRLEQADVFKSVTISSADLEKSGQRVRFNLKLDF